MLNFLYQTRMSKSCSHSLRTSEKKSSVEVPGSFYSYFLIKDTTKRVTCSRPSCRQSEQSEQAFYLRIFPIVCPLDEVCSVRSMYRICCLTSLFQLQKMLDQRAHSLTVTVWLDHSMWSSLRRKKEAQRPFARGPLPDADTRRLFRILRVAKCFASYKLQPDASWSEDFKMCELDALFELFMFFAHSG